MVVILDTNFASIFSKENTYMIPVTPAPSGEMELLETGIIQALLVPVLFKFPAVSP